jgi:G:T/U-mismatch repair DNA glycosylase
MPDWLPHEITQNRFWRVVGTVDEIQLKAVAMKQQFLRGIGFARALSFL